MDCPSRTGSNSQVILTKVIWVFDNSLPYTTSLPLHTDELLAMECSNAFTQSISEIAISSILVLTMCIVLLEKILNT